MPIGLTNIGWKMYMVNASWDIAILGLIVGSFLPKHPSHGWCKQWYYWVETKGKTVEEIDALFDGEKHSLVPDVELVRRGDVQIDDKALEVHIIREVTTINAE
jgi:hypothetical protein